MAQQRTQTDTFLIECARQGQADQNDHEGGQNSRWVNNLAQSMLLLPGDRINVEAAMVQSGIADGLIELTGDKDSTAGIEFAYYLTNDWSFSAPLPLYSSVVYSDFYKYEYRVSATDPTFPTTQSLLTSSNRFKANYGELHFSKTQLNTPHTKVSETLVNATKNLGPSYERLYAGIDYYNGFYANGLTETRADKAGESVNFVPVWDLKRSLVEFDIPVGFHAPDNIAQLLTDQMHRLDGTCESASVFDAWVPPILIRKQLISGADEYSLALNYNPTDPVSKLLPTASGALEFFDITFGAQTSDTSFDLPRKQFYRNLLTAEPNRLSAIGHLYNGIIQPRNLYQHQYLPIQITKVDDEYNFYSGIQNDISLAFGYMNGDGANECGNFGMQIAINDFLPCRYDDDADIHAVEDTFPHMPQSTDLIALTAANGVTDWNSAYAEQMRVGGPTPMGYLDLKQNDVVFTNLIANKQNVENIRKMFELLEYPDPTDGQMVADLDIGRADDWRCFSTRSDRMGRTATSIHTQQAEVESFALLSPPFAFDAANPDQFNDDDTTNTFKTYRQQKTPAHYVNGVFPTNSSTENPNHDAQSPTKPGYTGVGENQLLPLPSMPVLRKASLYTEATADFGEECYTSSREIDKWGYRLRVRTQMNDGETRPTVVAGKPSYKYIKGPITTTTPTQNGHDIFGGTAGTTYLLNGVQGIQDTSQRHASHGWKGDWNLTTENLGNFGGATGVENLFKMKWPNVWEEPTKDIYCPWVPQNLNGPFEKWGGAKPISSSSLIKIQQLMPVAASVTLVFKRPQLLTQIELVVANKNANGSALAAGGYPTAVQIYGHKDPLTWSFGVTDPDGGVTRTSTPYIATSTTAGKEVQCLVGPEAPNPYGSTGSNPKNYWCNLNNDDPQSMPSYYATPSVTTQTNAYVGHSTGTLRWTSPSGTEAGHDPTMPDCVTADNLGFRYFTFRFVRTHTDSINSQPSLTNMKPEMQIKSITLRASGIPEPNGALTQTFSTMQTNRPADALEPADLQGLPLVVGYRATPIEMFSAASQNKDASGAVTPLVENGISKVPFLGFIYNSQRVKDIPCPSLGELFGISRSLSDLKCAKAFSTQMQSEKADAKGSDNTSTNPGPAYDKDATPISTVNIGAADAKFLYNATLRRITLNELHTMMTSGQANLPNQYGNGRNYSDNRLYNPVGADDTSRSVQKLHFQTTVCRDNTATLSIDNINNITKIEEYKQFDVIGPVQPWGLMSAQSGIGITNIKNASTYITAANYLTEWSGSLWERLGFQARDLLALDHVNKTPQLLFSSAEWAASNVDGKTPRDRFVHQVSPLTTNGVVSTNQTMSLTANASGLPLFLAPGSVRKSNAAELQQNDSTDFIIASLGPSLYSYSHLVIYSDLVTTNLMNYIGADQNTNIPAVGYITKSYTTGNYIYGQQNPLVFTVEKPSQISKVLCDIRLPDGRPARLDPSSTIIFKIQRDKVVLNVSAADFAK